VSRPGSTRWMAFLVLGLLVTSSLAVLSLAIPPPSAGGTTETVRLNVPPVSTLGSGGVYGALLVGPGQSLALSANASNHGVYPIGGNITVNGGTLVVVGLQIRFEQFTATDNRWWANDLNFRYNILVENGGHLILQDSNITSDPNTASAYEKLNLSVVNDSVVSLSDGSALAFPGWIYVTGGSDLFLNDSRVEPDPIPATTVTSTNFTLDNAYSAALIITGGSQVLLNDSQIVGTYKDPLSPSASMAENFVNATFADLAPTGSVKVTGLVPATPLGLDSYAQWSSAGVLVSYTANTSSSLVGGSVSLDLDGNTYSAPAQYNPSNSSAFIPLPAGALTEINTLGLRDLLTAFQTGQESLTVSVSSGLTSGSHFNVTQVGLSLMPEFTFNDTFAGGSRLWAVNSVVDVNWHAVPGTAGCGVIPPSESNKLFLDGGSVAWLLNTTPPTYFENSTGTCMDQSAFVPDALSDFFVFQWDEAQVVGTSGVPQGGAILAPESAISFAADAWANTTANEYSNASYLQSNAPLFYQTMVYWARTSGSPSYGVTGGNGMALLAMPTAYVNESSLPDGYFLATFNLYVSGTAQLLSGAKISASNHTATPNLCPWPFPTGCVRPSPSPPVQMPLLSAALAISSVSLDTSQATNPECLADHQVCQVYEGNLVGVNVTIADLNRYVISDASGSVGILVQDNYSGLAGPSLSLDHYGEVTNTELAAGGGNTTVTIAYPVSYLSAGTHSLLVVLNPNDTAPQAAGVVRSGTASYEALGVPQITSSDVQVTVDDGCTGLPISSTAPNTCNDLKLLATVFNTGDATADNVYVTFALSGQTVGQVVIPDIPSHGSAQAETNATVFPGASPTGNATATVSWSSTAPTNPPPSIDVVGYTVVPLTDFTQLVAAPLNFTTTNYTGAIADVATSGGVPVGSVLTIETTLNNTGGPATGAYSALYLEPPVSGNATLLVRGSLGTDGAIAQTSSFPFELKWMVNESAFGGVLGPRTFQLVFYWVDSGTRTLNKTLTFSLDIRPPQVMVTGLSFTSQSYSQSHLPSPALTFTGGTLFFRGDHDAGIDVRLYSQSGGLNFSLADLDRLAGGYLSYLSGNDTPLAGAVRFVIPNTAYLTPGTYDILLVVNYDGENYYFHAPGTITILSSATPVPIYEQPLWLLLFIVIAVAAIAGVLLLLRRSGQGRLVECGECGELIPETATACPKCGAEFEVDQVRCSRCASTIPASSRLCPECGVMLLGREDVPLDKDPMRKGYEEFIEKYRAQARRELAENYTEGAFWDWWKRQPTYISFSAWKAQQAQGTRTGLVTPAAEAAKMAAEPGAEPPRGPGGRPPSTSPSAGVPPPAVRPTARPGGAPPGGETPAAPAPGMKACPSCQRQINTDFLVCPFCGAVTN
jgi:RNA polymerase subunit RPABC4/transcription elongation factor Spt4